MMFDVLHAYQAVLYLFAVGLLINTLETKFEKQVLEGAQSKALHVALSSIGFLRIFDHVFNMTTNNPGGPLNSTKPPVLMIYETAFTSFDMGYAAAQTVVLFLVLLGVSLVQLRILRDS